MLLLKRLSQWSELQIMMWARCITSLMHNEVICVGKETTKLRVAYDTSARTEKNPASLSDCHDVGPPQCLLSWLRFSVHQVAITGEIETQFSADCFSWPKIHVAWCGLMASQTDTQTSKCSGLFSRVASGVPSEVPCYQMELFVIALPPRSFPENLYVDDFVSGDDSVNSVFEM